MHGFNSSFIPIFDPSHVPIDFASNDHLGGMRNLLPLRPVDSFGYGKSKDELRALMHKLAARLDREAPWPDVLPNAVNAEDNPNIPSGYTYLLQLIAHDVVDTSVSLAAAKGRFFGFENARVQALT